MRGTVAVSEHVRIPFPPKKRRSRYVFSRIITPACKLLDSMTVGNHCGTRVIDVIGGDHADYIA